MSQASQGDYNAEEEKNNAGVHLNISVDTGNADETLVVEDYTGGPVDGHRSSSHVKKLYKQVKRVQQSAKMITANNGKKSRTKKMVRHYTRDPV